VVNLTFLRDWKDRRCFQEYLSIVLEVEWKIQRKYPNTKVAEINTQG